MAKKKGMGWKIILITIASNLIFIAFPSIFLILGCVNTKHPHLSKNVYSGNNPESPKLIIISLNIIKNKNHYSGSIASSIIVTTAKKIENPKTNQLSENDFVCFILDQNKTNLDTLLIIQPLHSRYEYPNDNGTIGSTIIEVHRTEVLLRFSYNTKMKYLRLAKVMKNCKLEALNTLEIPAKN